MPRSVRVGTKVGRSLAINRLSTGVIAQPDGRTPRFLPGRNGNYGSLRTPTGMGHRSMADDRRKPADGTAPMDRMSGWDDNEATRVRPTVDDAATRIRPAVDDAAATRIRPAADDDAATRIRPAVGTDATRVGSPDATRVSQDRVRAAYEDADRWAGSASVSAPRSAPGSTPPDAYDYDLEPVPDDQPNWLRPLLFGVVGLLLLGALLTGIWLIYTADDEPPTPQA